MLPPLNALRAFEAAQRHMSFQKAAEELHVTPAALSYQIRHLEDHLGIPLFRRLNRAVELTRQGEEIARGVEESFDRLRRTFERLQRPHRDNVLVITSGPAFSSKWLTPRIYRFLAKYPEIDLRISSSLALVDLHYGDIDIGLRFGRGEYKDCTSTKLHDEYLTPMFAPHLLEGDKAVRHPADLLKHPLVHDDTHMQDLKMPGWDDWLKAAEVSGTQRVAKGVHYSVADDALEAAVSGAGIILGRTTLAEGDLKTGRLVAPFPLKLKADYAFFAVVSQRRTDEPNIRHFIEWNTDEASGKVDTSIPGPVA